MTRADLQSLDVVAYVMIGGLIFPSSRLMYPHSTSSNPHQPSYQTIKLASAFSPENDVSLVPTHSPGSYTVGTNQ